jgi:rhodanese-related sulfurtransferase
LTVQSAHSTRREENTIMRARFPFPILLIAVLLAAALSAGCSTQDTGSPAATEAPAAGASGYTTVDVQTAGDALSGDPDAQIVDVREPEEWAETGVPQGAVLIPLGDLEARAASELVTERPVYVICRSGNRSQAGSDILVDLGFTEVYNVDGGVTAWLDAGLPVETYRQ